MVGVGPPLVGGAPSTVNDWTEAPTLERGSGSLRCMASSIGVIEVYGFYKGVEVKESGCYWWI